MVHYAEIGYALAAAALVCFVVRIATTFLAVSGPRRARREFRRLS